MRDFKRQFDLRTVGQLVAYLCFVLGMTRIGAGQEIVVRPEVVPTSGIVRLADVAEIRGADPATSERLGRLPLMPAPAAGTQRFLTTRGVRDMLVAHGEDVQQITFAGANQVSVQSPATSSEQDAQPSSTAVNTNDSDRSKAARMAALALGRVDGLQPTPASEVAEKGEQPPLGPPVAVAVRAVPRGAIITAADVTIEQPERAPIASSRRAPLYEVDDVIGMEAARAIQAGEMLYTDLVRKPALVKRGEAVTVVSQGGGIRVRTTARAVLEGGLGDLVQVESLDTKEKFDARVIGLREVGVLAPSREVTSPAPSRSGSSVAPFRRYLQASPNQTVNRDATAFRKYQSMEGATHGEIR